MRCFFTLIFTFLLSTATYASPRYVNVYAWSEEIPTFVVSQFENETGIKVNFSVYANNEIMYTKVRTAKKATYDVIMPSSYFVDRMYKQAMLLKLDKTKLSNYKNLNPLLLNPEYDPHSSYSVPLNWGVTGIFINENYYKKNAIKKWSDFWDSRFRDKLMALDDLREFFSISLLSLGYSINETDPKHIKKAYVKLKSLMPNIKVFSSETIVSIMIDEDATIGQVWNGDAYKASLENKNLAFIFPEDGFPIWVDTLAIPINAEHIEEAYAFINFLMRPDIAKEIALYTHFATANLAGQKLLPKEIRENKIIYPDEITMRRGKTQAFLEPKTLAIYEKYWEKLKMSG